MGSLRPLPRHFQHTSPHSPSHFISVSGSGLSLFKTRSCSVLFFLKALPGDGASVCCVCVRVGAKYEPGKPSLGWKSHKYPRICLQPSSKAGCVQGNHESALRAQATDVLAWRAFPTRQPLGRLNVSLGLGTCWEGAQAMDRAQAQTQPFPQTQGKGPRGQFTTTWARGQALPPALRGCAP